MGLGFSSKYMMVLLPLSLLPWLFFSPGLLQKTVRHFHWIVLGALIGALPVWLWNLQNDMASLRFQAEHGLGRRWKPSWTIHYIGAQI
jgi:4-amino-4-deoxy-L-arabinose transferase-like glycosyltransferase